MLKGNERTELEGNGFKGWIRIFLRRHLQQKQNCPLERRGCVVPLFEELLGYSTVEIWLVGWPTDLA